MAAKKPATSEPETKEPRAPSATIKLDGESVRFAPPDWAFAEMQWPLDAKRAPTKPRSFRDVWSKAHASPIVSAPRAVAKGPFDRAKARSLETAPTSLDVELEAHALYLTTLRALRGTTVFNVTSDALAWWSALASPTKATEVALRALAITGFGNDAIMLALREHLRIHGVDSMAAMIRTAVAGQDRATALLLDDAKAAERYRRTATNPFMLTLLLGLFADPVIAGALLSAICEDTQFVPVPPVLRAVRRHGTQLAPVVLPHVDRVMEDPGHSDAEKAPWLAVLACYPSVRSARLASSLLTSKSIRPVVMQTLLGMMTEAKAALTTLKAGKGKVATAAKVALAELA